MKTILVVDDDALMLGVMKDALRREYSITCVSNGQEAQDLLTQEKYDLVITDLTYSPSSLKTISPAPWT